MQLDSKNNSQYIADIKAILDAAKQQVYSSVNSAMVQAYWLIGKRIVEEEQNGKERAEYGSFLIKNLSLELTKEFGKGFSEQSLKNFRQFFIVFKDLQIGSTPWSQLPNQKSSTLWSQLSWSHFKSNNASNQPRCTSLLYKRNSRKQLVGANLR
jgi:hypothetical protein